MKKKPELLLSKKVDKLLKEKPFKRETLARTIDTTILDKLSEKGLLEKPKYTLPLLDTLGRRFYETSKFNAK